MFLINFLGSSMSHNFRSGRLTKQDTFEFGWPKCEWLVKFCRSILVIQTTMCCLNLKQFDYSRQIKQTKKSGSKLDDIEITHKRNYYTLILKITFFLLFFVTYLRIMYSIVLKYNYDHATIRLEHINQIIQLANTTGNLSLPSEEDGGYLGFSSEFLSSIDVFEFQAQLEQTKKQTWSKLKQFGCLYYDGGFFTVTLLIVSMSLATTTYLVPFVYYNVFYNFDRIFFVNLLLNEKLELNRVRQSINAELKHLMNSSGNYIIFNTSFAINEIDTYNWIKENGRSKLKLALERLNKKSKLKQIISEHIKLKSMIKSWRESNELMPMNISKVWSLASMKLFLLLEIIFIWKKLMDDKKTRRDRA